MLYKVDFDIKLKKSIYSYMPSDNSDDRPKIERSDLKIVTVHLKHSMSNNEHK